MSQLTTRTFDLTKLLTGPYYCSGCASRVCEGVEALDGVTAAVCDLPEGKLEVTYDHAAISHRDIERVVERFALEAADRVGHSAYRISGLD